MYMRGLTTKFMDTKLQKALKFTDLVNLVQKAGKEEMLQNGDKWYKQIQDMWIALKENIRNILYIQISWPP